MPPPYFSIGWALSLGLVASLPAIAQTYPTKPIRIVTSDIGGGADLVARALAQGIAGPLGQQVIVENRVGGTVAGEAVANAAPDGYTLLFYGSSFWLLPLMREYVPYNPLRDFAPITLAVSSPVILVVHPSLPVKSVKDLLGLARARPGALDYASAAAGTINHLAAELFKAIAGVNIVRIPYKGNGQALNAVISGEVQMMFPAAGSVASHIKSGRLRALGVASAQPSLAYPDLPTISSAGLPGYEAISPLAMFAPAKTPSAIINRLNREAARALNEPDVKQRFLSGGSEVIAGSPQQLNARMKSEIENIGKVIKAAGIRDE